MAAIALITWWWASRVFTAQQMPTILFLMEGEIGCCSLVFIIAACC